MNNKLNFNIDIIIEEYSNYVYKIINNIVGSSLSFEDKEELVSDIFFLLWKNQQYIKTNLKAYLATITRHCTFKRLKSRFDSIELNENTLSCSHLDEDIDNILIIKEKLKKLSSDELKLFNLFYVEGLKIKEISKLLGKSSSNIKIKLFRIRRKLKEEFLNE